MLPRTLPFVVLLLSIATIPLEAMACPSVVSQRVLVTGAGRGIGRAIALICSRHGAKVAITSRTRSELEETSAIATSDDVKDSTPMRIHVADVTNVSQVEDTVKSIVKEWGGIDILINNAGGAQQSKGPLESLPSDDLRSLLDLNVVGVHAVTSAVLRHAMLPAGSGRIVNISSRAGKVGLPTMSAYCASKFALEGMTAALAEEVKDKGIEVNTLSPGMVNTRSFPKPEGRKGVRSAESIEDSLFALLEGGVTGHYVHADELDEARAKGLADSAALKPIREAMYSP
ncbi:hypothetical protein ACHAXT_010772 [Thalassiosira profunda]